MKTNTPTCLVLGSMPMDVIQRKNAAGTVDRLYVHVGHTAGNVATMLAAEFGWRTLPVAHFDGFGWGGRLKEDLGRYGADLRFVTTGGDRGTTFFVETHKTGRDGLPAVGRETRVPRGGRFPNYCFLTKDTAQALLSGPLADPPPPDVLFFTEPIAGHRLVAEGLRARGTFVYFEPPKRMTPRELASGIAVADVVKFSNEDYPDVSFADGLAGMLAIQTMKGAGVRFNLRGEGWRTVPPVANPDFVDGEGAGDWTSSALLAALGRRGLPRIADLDEATVADCLREAQATSSRSVGFLGSKGMLEDRFPTPAAWLDPAQDPAPPPAPPSGPKKEKAAPAPVDCGKGGTMFCPPTPFEKKTGWTVFLAGPIGGAPEWQRSVPKLAEKLGLEGVTWLNPRGKHLSHRPQVEWETRGLRVCDYILFWVPAQAKPADKPYALTTRMELAENLARGKRVVLGIDPDVPWMRHAKFLAERYGVKKVHATLEDCLRALKRELARRKPAEREIDGPAWVAETLARHPVCVDDLARNQLLVEQWNRAFTPGDVVRVRGGLPVDPSLLPLLNGDIRVG